MTSANAAPCRALQSATRSSFLLGSTDADPKRRAYGMGMDEQGLGGFDRGHWAGGDGPPAAPAAAAAAGGGGGAAPDV